MLTFVGPTILRVKGFRFYFFSRDERRVHVHVQHADREAKFWIDLPVERADWSREMDRMTMEIADINVQGDQWIYRSRNGAVVFRRAKRAE